jgi:predicted RNase H-like HicB family nuclease
METEYAVVYERTDTGYSAYVPDLPGCIAAGYTYEETRDLLRGAIAMHLKAMAEDGDLIPAPTTLVGTLAAAA